MSDVVKRAEHAVEEARRDTVSVELVAALLAAQQQPSGCSCQQQAPVSARPRRSAGQLAAVAGGVAVCGCVLTGLFLAVALAAVGVAVSALVCLFIVREIRKR